MKKNENTTRKPATRVAFEVRMTPLSGLLMLVGVLIIILSVRGAQAEAAQEEVTTVPVATSEVLPTDDIPAEIQTIAYTVDASDPDILPTDDVAGIILMDTPEGTIVLDSTTTTDSVPEVIETVQEYTTTQAASQEEETEQEPPRTYNGITEGDVIDGNLSFYDVCLTCCGKLDGVTASGVRIYNGMEDPHVCSCNWLPLGSVISVNGVEYTVSDRGGSGLSTVGRVDIFTPAGHQAALNLGRQEAEITIISIAES